MYLLVKSFQWKVLAQDLGLDQGQNQVLDQDLDHIPDHAQDHTLNPDLDHILDQGQGHLQGHQGQDQEIILHQHKEKKSWTDWRDSWKKNRGDKTGNAR